MKTLLLDTNIVSFIFKKDTRAENYKKYLEGNREAISFTTIGELYQWASIRNWGDIRKKKLEETLNQYIILGVNIDLCYIWGKIRSKCHLAGKPISVQDAWIAATSLLYNIPLVTHNPKDFELIEKIEIITTVKI